MSDATDAGDFLRGQWAEPFHGRGPRTALESGAPLHWCTDSKDLHDALSKEGIPSCAEKRLALEVCSLREISGRDANFAHWVSTHQMLSDCLTKGVDARYLRERLGAATWSLVEADTVAKVPHRWKPNKARLETPEEHSPETVLLASPHLLCPRCGVKHREPDLSARFFRGIDLWKPHRQHVCHKCHHRWRTPQPTLGCVPTLSPRADSADRSPSGTLTRRRESRVNFVPAQRNWSELRDPLSGVKRVQQTA